MPKKNIIVLVCILLFILGLVVFLIFQATRLTKPVQPENKEPKREAPEIGSRPFFFLTPRSDGKAFNLKVTRIPDGAKIDYEITYMTEGVTQGVIGQVVPQAGQDFYEREHIFGTCSRNVCKYDRNVEFGKWKATVKTEENIYEMQGDFHLQKLETSGGKIELADKLTADIPKGGVKKTAWVITQVNDSLPSSLPSETRVEEGPFSIGSSAALSGQAKLNIILSQIPLNTTLKVLFWDNNKNTWIDIAGEVDRQAKTIASRIDSFGTFVVVSTVQ